MLQDTAVQFLLVMRHTEFPKSDSSSFQPVNENVINNSKKNQIQHGCYDTKLLCGKCAIILYLQFLMLQNHKVGLSNYRSVLRRVHPEGNHKSENN